MCGCLSQDPSVVVSELVNAVFYAHPAANIYPGIQAKAMMLVRRFHFSVLYMYFCVKYVYTFMYCLYVCMYVCMYVHIFFNHKDDSYISICSFQILLSHYPERIADMDNTADVFPESSRPKKRDSPSITTVMSLLAHSSTALFRLKYM